MKKNIGFIDDEFDLESLRNVPTAKEFYLKEVFPVSYERNPSDVELWYETDGHVKNVVSIMIEFAKLHVEAALKVASESESDGTFGRMIYPNSILTCYPLENID
jgi:hypothetical protein